jgi:hypothetical protein
MATCEYPSTGIVHDGIDEMDVHVDVQPPLASATAASVTRRSLARHGLVAASVTPNAKPADDYDSSWFLKSHPSTFPHNKGACPAGMSVELWIQTLLQRYPREQFAQNLPFNSDAFNIIQRHSVYKNAWIQFKSSPDRAAALAHLTEGDVNIVLDAITRGLFGASLNATLDTTCDPVAARTLMNGIRAVGGRVEGSPQAFLALRSKVIAPHVIFGHYTVALNLCPSELGAVWTFALAGKNYTFDAEGNPQGRPHLTACRRLIAANPVACAEFFRAYITGFLAVFCGWPIDSECQKDANCMFGVLTALYLKYENGDRGGLHCHGQGAQPFLSSERLKALFEGDNARMQQALFDFFESIMCAYFPSPVVNPTSAVPTTPIVNIVPQVNVDASGTCARPQMFFSSVDTVLTHRCCRSRPAGR